MHTDHSAGHRTNAPTIARTLARYVVDLKFEDLPPSAVQAAKDAVLDQLGTMLTGATLPWTRPALEVVAQAGGRPECVIVGTPVRAPAAEAAFVNAIHAHACEFDDSSHDAACHPGALTVPPALALAARAHLGGKDFLLAVVAGYEILSRIGRVMCQPILERGFHHHSVVGPFGTAATAGKLLGLDAETLMHALAIAGSHACGTMEYDQSGGEVKRLHAGIPVRGGMMAAFYAERGITGPDTIFEGPRGIPRAFGGLENPQAMVADLNHDGPWSIEQRIVKPYPTLGALHTGIQAMARLRKEQGLVAAQVRDVHVHVNPLGVAHGGAIQTPRDVIGAQFSMAYSLALCLVRGGNELRDYIDSALWTDPRIVALAMKVRVHGDPAMVGERRFAARVEVLLEDGRRLVVDEPWRKGSTRLPFSAAELEAKFRSLASAVLDEAGMRRVLDTVARLEELPDLSELAELLAAPRPA